jgi:hypothetical protein
MRLWHVHIPALLRAIEPTWAGVAPKLKLAVPRSETTPLSVPSAAMFALTRRACEYDSELSMHVVNAVTLVGAASGDTYMMPGAYTESIVLNVKFTTLTTSNTSCATTATANTAQTIIDVRISLSRVCFFFRKTFIL